MIQPNSLKYAATLYPAKAPSTPAYEASKLESPHHSLRTSLNNETQLIKVDILVVQAEQINGISVRVTSEEACQWVKPSVVSVNCSISDENV